LNIICNENEQTIYLSKKGMKISFGAVGKGYAAERAKKILQEMGIENGLINAGGDIAAWGNQANGKTWGIAIQHPRDEQKGMAWLEIDNQAIVTSGDYEAYKIIDGKRYSHIIDPRSGNTSDELISVTVISYNAELADANFG
jgi:thiamine biosynthesis lipoprotein